MLKAQLNKQGELLERFVKKRGLWENGFYWSEGLNDSSPIESFAISILTET